MIGPIHLVLLDIRAGLDLDPTRGCFWGPGLLTRAFFGGPEGDPRLTERTRGGPNRQTCII